MEIDRSKLNVIAFYLPQYHTIPENDAAYGKGFTEWTNVKKAEPLFEGHRQPRVPLNDNYYCLLDNGKTMKWQANLAKENGIFGFCYYHYYFGNGKLLLEKPLEEMLTNKKIDIPFCLCWANENWTRRWDGGNNEIIAKQDYDNLDSIGEHVKYLSKFMKNERYITIDGKPLLIIYKPELIPNIKKYIERIRNEFSKNGFPYVNIICQYPLYYLEKKNIDVFDYYIQFQPEFSYLSKQYDEKPFKQVVKKVLNAMHLYKLYGLLQRLSKNSRELKIRDYNEEWKHILDYVVKDKKLLAGAFVDWDNTPRRKTGVVYKNVSVEKFDKYYGELTNKIRNEYSLPVVFVTAWNEWGEGSYLEPDKDVGDGYLKVIKKYVY